MSDKYGFGSGIELPKIEPARKRMPVDRTVLSEAVEAGRSLGFVDREPGIRRRPGPKRTELQDKVSIPGPKRVIDSFRAYCAARDVTLWRGLEMLLDEKQSQAQTGQGRAGR